MQQVELGLQQQAHTQKQQHAELQQNILGVQQHFETQTKNMHSVLDSRFHEQLMHIERLISNNKRKSDEAVEPMADRDRNMGNE